MMFLFVVNQGFVGGIRQVTCDDLAVLQLQLQDGVLANIVINANMSGFNQANDATFGRLRDFVQQH